MRRVEVIAELATGHGGDVGLAEAMIAAAAEAGADTVKIQSYTLARLNPSDPQADWLKHAYLDEAAHVRLMKACQRHGLNCFSTPFDGDSFRMLLRLGFGGGRIKVASSQTMWKVGDMDVVYFTKSWAWGRKPGGFSFHIADHLTAIPLYPTPLEAVGQAPLLDGWSDHTIGTSVCKHMISQGARIIEAHLCLPGQSRQMPWDKTPEQFRELRDWANEVETMTSGIATTFRDRWTA